MSLPGSFMPVAAFNAAFIAMLLLALPRPRFYVYTFLALFLFLGFWAKYWVHGALAFAFIEPIGAFDGSAAAWDRALWLASAGAAGIAAARLAQLIYHRGRGLADILADAAGPPRWFVRHRRAVWAAFGLLVVLVDLWNVQAAFYQIGVNPRLVLPLSLNVVMAWLVNIAFALGVAVLVHWEITSRGAAGALVAPIVEAVVCSASTLSRSAYVLHAGPYVLAALERHRELLRLVSRTWRARLAGVIVAGALIALLGVQWLRTAVYFAPAALPAASSSAAAAQGGFNYLPSMMEQLPLLLVHRWVGLEGVLAASAHPQIGPELFREALKESPKAGMHSLYQGIARSAYKDSAQFTFLTLPGLIGVLAYSASLAIVFCGAALVSALVLGTEWLAARWTGNPFLLAVAGAAMANVASNLNFPYLAAIFMAELWFTLVVIALLHGGRAER